MSVVGSEIDAWAMNTRPTQIKRHKLLLVILIALGTTACSAAVAARAHDGSTVERAGSYHWPVKPFDQPHPVRGVFGDPRTTFNGPPTPAGLNGPGIFLYHFGVDISAPAGTPVYPVRSGVAHLRSGETVVVSSGAGEAFEYWHIVPAVDEGEHVTAYTTVLGRIRAGECEHVHLTELQDGRPVNPLAPGHLTPYGDHTRPCVTAARFRDARTGRELLPEFVHGRVEIAVSASDTSSMAVPGRWSGLPIVPARITWRIERAKDGRVVRRPCEAFDVRTSLPRAPFWSTYARGTRQNAATFAGHKLMRQPGVYLFRLAANFDTGRLGRRDDVYVLVVEASDSGGNVGTARFVFTVHKSGYFA